MAVVVPRVLLLMNPDDPSNAFQQPSYVVGYTVGADRGHETFPLEIAQGRATSVGDEGQMVVFLGSDLNQSQGEMRRRWETSDEDESFSRYG